MGARESNVVVLNVIIIPNLIGTDTIRSCWNGGFVGRTTKPVVGAGLEVSSVQQVKCLIL